MFFINILSLDNSKLLLLFSRDWSSMDRNDLKKKLKLLTLIKKFSTEKNVVEYYSKSAYYRRLLKAFSSTHILKYLTKPPWREVSFFTVDNSFIINVLALVLPRWETRNFQNKLETRKRKMKLSLRNQWSISRDNNKLLRKSPLNNRGDKPRLWTAFQPNPCTRTRCLSAQYTR